MHGRSALSMAARPSLDRALAWARAPVWPEPLCGLAPAAGDPACSPVPRAAPGQHPHSSCSLSCSTTPKPNMDRHANCPQWMCPCVGTPLPLQEPGVCVQTVAGLCNQRRNECGISDSVTTPTVVCAAEPWQQLAASLLCVCVCVCVHSF